MFPGCNTSHRETELLNQWSRFVFLSSADCKKSLKHLQCKCLKTKQKSPHSIDKGIQNKTYSLRLCWFSEQMLVWKESAWQQEFSPSWLDLPYTSDTLSHQVQPSCFCSAGGVGLALVLDKTTFKENLCDVKEMLCLQYLTLRLDWHLLTCLKCHTTRAMPAVYHSKQLP